MHKKLEGAWYLKSREGQTVSTSNISGIRTVVAIAATAATLFQPKNGHYMYTMGRVSERYRLPYSDYLGGGQKYAHLYGNCYNYYRLISTASGGSRGVAQGVGPPSKILQSI